MAELPYMTVTWTAEGVEMILDLITRLKEERDHLRSSLEYVQQCSTELVERIRTLEVCPSLPRCCGTCLHRSHIREMSRPHIHWTECRACANDPLGLPASYRNLVNGHPWQSSPMGVHEGLDCPAWRSSLS
jgi:hypothetical protein